jgi:hypothetical protein
LKNFISNYLRENVSSIFRVFLFVGVIVFLSYYLKGINFGKLRELQLRPLPLIASLVLSLSFRYWGVFIWRNILKDLGSSKLPQFGVLASIYAQSWMARYIPGTVTWIAGRVFLARDLGISKSRLTVASLIEAGIQIVAIAATSMLLLSFDERINDVVSGEIRVLVLAASLVLALLLIPTVFNQLLRVAYRAVRGADAYSELATNGKATFRSFLLYAFGSFVSGISYYFMAMAIWDSTAPSDMIYIIGAVNLSGVIGMATPFVPSGLGVRDATQLILLSAIFPKEIALVLTIFSRLWSLIIDVIFLATASWCGRKN